MTTLRIIEYVNNYRFDELEVQSSALDQFVKEGRFSAEMVCRNEYGSRFTVAYCMVTGDPMQLSEMARKAYNSTTGYETFPAESFVIK